MENTPTDTQSSRPKQWEVDYWAQIDRTDMELSGEPLKYHTDTEVLDSLGVESSYLRVILGRMRKRCPDHLVQKIMNRLDTPRDNIEQDGQL